MLMFWKGGVDVGTYTIYSLSVSIELVTPRTALKMFMFPPNKTKYVTQNKSFSNSTDFSKNGKKGYPGHTGF